MISRTLTTELESAARAYPVVTLTGPRQSGKTTLAKEVFSEYTYCNLEEPETRELAQSDPKAFFHANPAPVIIDEVQRVPSLMSWIQVRVDEDDAKGAYILTGSQQLHLHEALGQSLAGRTSILRLLPLSLLELEQAGIRASKEEHLFQGFMPRVHKDKLDPTAHYRNYFQTYVERDVRQLLQLKNLRLFETFMRLLAARVGQPLNLSSLASDVGVSSTTLGEWLSILEASYLVFCLPPYFKNYGKRLIKAPKLYFVEPGLAAWLLGIENPNQALRDPLHGSLFENMVVVEALKAQYHRGREPGLYFWRDNARHEIDLVLEKRRKPVPIEIKSAMTWNAHFEDGIRWFRRAISDAEPGFVVYAGDQVVRSEHYRAIHFKDTHEILDGRIHGDKVE